MKKTFEVKNQTSQDKSPSRFTWKSPQTTFRKEDLERFLEDFFLFKKLKKLLQTLFQKNKTN